MSVQYFEQANIESLKYEVSILDDDNQVMGIILFLCDNDGHTAQSLDPLLKSIKTTIFFFFFPAIILNDKKYDTGFILATCSQSPIINLVEEISKESRDFDNDIMRFSDKYEKTKTMFVFIDGFANRISSFIESLFTIFGLEFNYIGGGAGSLSLQQKPCIITNEGLKQDCAVLAGIELQSGIGVEHGWESIAGPFKVTSAEKTIIKQLDFQPAFNIYKNIVEEHSGLKFNGKNFFSLAKAYPFGINKFDAEKVVRDPLFIKNETQLVCVGEVETGYFVDILTGNKEMLISAAGNAIQLAIQDKGREPEEFILFIDCISRVLFLENDFEKELYEVRSKHIKVPLFGALTIGEIANNGKDYLEFYNKTAVVGCF